jgi:hypothetical protein
MERTEERGGGIETELRNVDVALLTNRDQKRSTVEVLAPVYQRAFAGEPWFEVSRCSGCARGFSGESPGQHCAVCGTFLTSEAYPIDELTQQLGATIASEQSVVYLEQLDQEVLLGALAWIGSPGEIATRKYADATPELAAWLAETLPEECVWLDEVFASRSVRKSGNLWNFRSMCIEISQALNQQTLAYRSINPRIIGKAQREFGLSCRVYEPQVDIPDRRAFVVIKLEGSVR